VTEQNNNNNTSRVLSKTFFKNNHLNQTMTTRETPALQIKPSPKNVKPERSQSVTLTKKIQNNLPEIILFRNMLIKQCLKRDLTVL
jgi:hypothetical protein